MLILSLDTTTRAGSAAVLDDDTVLAVASGDASRTHGERLPGELEQVLATAGVTLARIDLLAVARGPGAFTGLRIGLAAMQGIAMVTGHPVVGVSALDALAVVAFEQVGAPHARVGAWMDAARGEVFAAAYDATAAPGGLPALAVLAEPEVGAPEAVWARWQALGPAEWVLVGDGAERYTGAAGHVRLARLTALAPAIGRLGRRHAQAEARAPHDLQPLYVRRPDAERPPR